MSNEPQSPPANPPTHERDDSGEESLTDLIDRLDREAFLRLLDLRHVRVHPHAEPRR
jgi:hypothetical protein